MYLRSLLGAVALCLGLGCPVSAEMALSTSNPPTAADLEAPGREAPQKVTQRLPRPSLRDRLSGLFGAGFEAAEAPAGLRRLAVRFDDSGRVYYDEAWLDAQPPASGDAEWRCLAEALYFEARGESVQGQFAVAEVIMNRVASRLYPDTVCGVVHQGTGRRMQCQFTWTCDGHSDRILERSAFVRVGKVARLVMDGAPRVLTEGATHYHTRLVMPQWARTFPRTAEIGVHYFYRHPRS